MSIRYRKFKSKRQLRTVALLLASFLILISITVFCLSADLVIRSFTVVIVTACLTFWIGVFLAARNTFLQVDSEFVSWEGILTRTPKAHISLSKIAKISHIQERWGDGNAQVMITLSCGSEYFVPVPDDNTMAFFEALDAAAPHADAATDFGSLESPWPYIRQAVFNRNRL